MYFDITYFYITAGMPTTIYETLINMTNNIFIINFYSNLHNIIISYIARNKL